jgi:hypothetical protein
MNASVSSSIGITSETTLQKEQRLFGELFARLIDAFLNRIFDLRPAKAARRRRYLLLLFFVSGFLISLQYYPLALWAKFVQDIFLYSLNPAYASTYVGNPFTNFLAFAYQVFTDPRIFQYVPIFLAPFFIAVQCAALYLADVFELEHISVARSFIWEVALSGSDETIRITQGDISEANRESPNYLIGGPGKVVVDLDSVALFEKPDGTPHIIGPTGKEVAGRATLDGFERFRQAIDIRDQYVDLRDQDSKSQSVKSRSRDGIPVSATDVRMMFSVYRGEGSKPAAESPYPFSKEAIEQIIYKSVSRVTPELANPSTYEFSWVNNMIGLIRGQLSGFMSEHKLSEYLASTGMPEFEKLKQREETITEQVQQLTHSEQDFLASKELKSPPEFQPRYKITNLFNQFAEEFTKRAHGGGVELHWIGVGTWKTPIELVPEKHLEAWKLSQENAKKESKGAMEKVEEKAIIQKLQTLIDTVPIEVYHDILNSVKHTKKNVRKPESKQPTAPDPDKDKKLSEEELEESNQEAQGIVNFFKILSESTGAAHDFSEADYIHAIRTLLLEYRKQLTEAVEFMKAKNEAVPQNIEEAIKHIDNQMGLVHWAGKR